MRRNTPPTNEPSDSDDPLRPYNASTVRAKVDRGSTQHLNMPGTDLDVPDWSNRREDRLKRQGSGSRVYPANVRTFIENVNNRQLLMIGGGIFVLLAVLLLLKGINRPKSDTTTTGNIPTQGSQIPSAVPNPNGNQVPGSIVTPGSLDVAPSPVAQVSNGKKFTVVGTEGQGLFIRDQPSRSGAQVGTLPENTVVEAAEDPEQSADGYTWVKIISPQGQGWVAKDFLQPAQ